MPQLRKLIFQLSSLAGSFYLFATRVLADGESEASSGSSLSWPIVLAIIAVLALVIYFLWNRAPGKQDGNCGKKNVRTAPGAAKRKGSESCSRRKR